MSKKIPDKTLLDQDEEISVLIEKEKNRQWRGLELIASENFTSRAVMEAIGSAFTNKYSEGLPGARYYGGNEFVDELELLCEKRALEAFNLDPEEWGVNVQPYSGSTANFAALTGMLSPHQRLMGLDLPSGGHLTHGYQTKKKKVSATSIYFESMPYQVNSETGYVDYDQLEANAELFRPNLIVAGASAYPRDWDYERMREIADKHNAYLWTDMAHISGLVAAGMVKSPFEHSDVVTSTTHKSLRGPRSGLIFYRKDARPKLGLEAGELENKINFAVFPSCQGGPHNHTIAGVAVCLKEANTDEFKEYVSQLMKNAVCLADALTDKGYSLVTGGTENHLLLWDLRPQGLTGSKMEKICERVHITLNKNSVHGDTSAFSPGGVRIGTPALTSRGMDVKDMETIAGFLDRACKIALAIQEESGKRLVDFVSGMETNKEQRKNMDDLSLEVQKFASQFPIPGWNLDEQKLQEIGLEK